MDANLKHCNPTTVAVAWLGCAAAWLFAPELAQAAVAFGDMGQNVADNAKGIAKGIQYVGFAGGLGMAVLGVVDMYNICNLLPK